MIGKFLTLLLTLAMLQLSLYSCYKVPRVLFRNEPHDMKEAELPAGILQGVFFDDNHPMYMNYGGIGLTIGHEFTHAFDGNRRKYGSTGENVEWGPETEKAYLERVDCVIKQYGDYVTDNGLKLDGRQTILENIADNVGMKAAYWAYNSWLNENITEPKLPELPYNAKQMFWISAAGSWCRKYKLQGLSGRISSYSHSPAKLRIRGSFSNMPEFAEDFECPKRSVMNPLMKCRLQ